MDVIAFVLALTNPVIAEPIGKVGLFWASDGIVHVHWRLWAGGRPVDPMSRSIGCFDRARDYSSTPGFTFPLAC